MLIILYPACFHAQIRSLHLRHAAVAYGGLGANIPEDAVYPTVFVDASGEPLHSDRRYVMHFEKTKYRQCTLSASLTLHNGRQLLADNPIYRYVIGDLDTLTFNPDDSLDLYVQRESPGTAKESNWLPTPADSNFSLMMRLYWPALEVLDRSMTPPQVKWNN